MFQSRGEGGTRTGVTRGLPGAQRLPQATHALGLGSWTPHSGCLLHVGKWPGLCDPRPGGGRAGQHPQMLGGAWPATCRALGSACPGSAGEPSWSPGRGDRDAGKERQGAWEESRDHEGWGEGLLSACGLGGGKISMAPWGDANKPSMLAGPGKPHKEFDFVPEGSGEPRRSVGKRETTASRLHWTL